MESADASVKKQFRPRTVESLTSERTGVADKAQTYFVPSR